MDLDLSNINKNIDAAEDSDASNIPTEPPSPNRPESETRGKKKCRGRQPSSARRSGRSTRARTQAVSVLHNALQLFNPRPF